MWTGKLTDELKELYKQYYEMFETEPDWYAEIFYDGMSYEEYVGFIRECLKKKVEIPYVVK